MVKQRKRDPPYNVKFGKRKMGMIVMKQTKQNKKKKNEREKEKW